MAVPEQFGIENMVIGITGAGKGIGRGLVTRAVEAGARVFACSRTEEDLVSLEKEVADLDGSYASIALDLTKPEAPERFVDFGIRSYGRLDAVINNAGFNFAKPALDCTVEEFDLLYELNLRSVYFTCLAAARYMIKEKVAGSIVNISTKGSLVASPRITPYTAMKAGVNQLTRSLAAEWAEYGIRVNAVAPGATATPLFLGHVASKALSEEVVTKKILLGHRPMTIDEITFPTLFFLSPAAAMITGQTLAVDGGSSLGA